MVGSLIPSVCESNGRNEPTGPVVAGRGALAGARRRAFLGKLEDEAGLRVRTPAPLCCDLRAAITVLKSMPGQAAEDSKRRANKKR